jgi:heme/copper-type cytochrome/quinol oxidase subunit 3
MDATPAGPPPVQTPLPSARTLLIMFATMDATLTRVCSIQRLRTSGAQRFFATFALVLLFLSGPVHVWHHTAGKQAAGGRGGEGGQCVPCSTFHNLFFDRTCGLEIGAPLICLGTLAPASAVAPAAVSPILPPSRAPPCASA